MYAFKVVQLMDDLVYVYQNKQHTSSKTCHKSVKFYSFLIRITYIGTYFLQEKEAFVERYKKEKYPLETNKKNLSADEMSEFYKSFLDRKLADHSTYNLQWQIRNFKIVCLSIAVSLEKLLKW